VPQQNEQEVLLQPGTPLYIDAIVPRANNIIEVQAHEVTAVITDGATPTAAPTSTNAIYGQGFAMLSTPSGAENGAQAELPLMEGPSFSLVGASITLPVQGSSSTDGNPSSGIVPVTAGISVPSITAPSKKGTTTTKSKKKFKQSNKAFERKGSVVGLLSDDGDATAPDENGMYSI
jgi:hypothetical protein